MKKSIKKLIAAVLALSCAMPAAVIPVSAAEDGALINYYSFDGTNPLASSTTGANGGTMGGKAAVVSGIGSNTTNVLKLSTSTASEKTNFYHLSYLGKNELGNEKWLNISDEQNKYVKVDAKIYINNDGFSSVCVGDFWGGALTGTITKDMLTAGVWNDISFISQYTNKRLIENIWYWDIYTDIIVNGVRVAENSPVTRYNAKYRALGAAATDDDIDRFYMTLLLQGDGKNTFAAYVDDVKTTTYTEKNFSSGFLINSWKFEGNPFHKNDQETLNNATAGGGSTILSAIGIGSNATVCAQISTSQKSTYPQLNVYRTKAMANAGQIGYVPDLYDETTNPYLLIKFDIFVGSNVQKFYIGNVWSSQITDAIDVSKLKANEWNNAAVVLKLTDKEIREDGKAVFNIVSDTYINGVLVSDSTKIARENPAYNSANPDSADAYGTVIAFEGSDTYTVYLDNISVMQKYGDMKSESEFLLDRTKIAPKLVATDCTSVKDNVVSVITGTTSAQLEADIDGAQISATDADGAPREGALEEGDIIYVSSADGISAFTQYTVKIIESKVVAPTYYVSKGSNGVWSVYYSTTDYETAKKSTLEAGTYAFPAEIINTTGKDVNIMTVLALFEKDDKLIGIKTVNKTVPSSLSKQSVRVDYNTSESDLGDGRYIRAFILTNPSLVPVSYGTVTY